MRTLGYFHGIDPAACVVDDGRLVAYVEEERLIRVKHADGIFPVRSMRSCLDLAGLELGDIDAFTYGWNVPSYTNGGMARFYDEVNAAHPPDEGTTAWQRRNLGLFHRDNVEARMARHALRAFGAEAKELPSHAYVPHHLSHAAAAFYLSPADEALVLTLDGSGDGECTTLWHGRGATLEPLHKIEIPHSLGWFYAAMTEFLGFDAYDGEYKVMGLAAYGRGDQRLRERLAEVVRPGPSGWDYVVDPRYLHRGSHVWSDRFSDSLVDLLGLPPRVGGAPLEPLHEDLAYETQRLLEVTVQRLVEHWADATGLRTLCIGGGVGLNVKMNSRIHRSGRFDHVYAFPIPNDSGTAIGSAIAIDVRRSGRRPEPLEHLFLGPGFDDASIAAELRSCGLDFTTSDDIAADTAALLSEGKVVGWFQGRMEGGPRALGGRSILADPRAVAARDRVNSAVKFREYWRPFCPSLTVEAAGRYLVDADAAPFMIMGYEATPAAAADAPAIVHVDGTVRPQTVSADVNPRYHALIEAFGERTGVPVVLNTSFNVKGEAIVCTPRDALRTFWSTGLDALAIGSHLVQKLAPPEPLPVGP